MHQADVIRGLLMYGLLPLWLAAGFADWLCHRASAIEKTSGPKESLLHIAQFAQMGLGLLAVLFLEVTAGVFALLILCLLAHQLTAIWDVRYANGTRMVGPAEQHVHGVLENLPFAAVALLAVLHWPAFAALASPPQWLDLRPKADALPMLYIGAVLLAAGVFGVVPYAEELIRTVRAAANKDA
jgi:hypothetical protein